MLVWQNLTYLNAYTIWLLYQDIKRSHMTFKISSKHGIFKSSHMYWGMKLCSFQSWAQNKMFVYSQEKRINTKSIALCLSPLKLHINCQYALHLRINTVKMILMHFHTWINFGFMHKYIGNTFPMLSLE